MTKPLAPFSDRPALIPAARQKPAFNALNATRGFQDLSFARHAFATEDAKPITASIQLALLRSVDELTDTAAARMQRIRARIEGERPVESTDDKETLALLALGETIVANALQGNQAATRMVLDRIEGPMQPTYDDREDGAVRASVASAIETAVRIMANAPLPGDDAKVINGDASQDKK